MQDLHRVRRHWLQLTTKCQWRLQQLCNSCMTWTCFKFYCMFYCSCDHSIIAIYSCRAVWTGLNSHRIVLPKPLLYRWLYCTGWAEKVSHRYLMIALMQISWRMWQWKNSENQPTFEEVMCRVYMYIVAYFLAHPGGYVPGITNVTSSRVLLTYTRTCKPIDWLNTDV